MQRDTKAKKYPTSTVGTLRDANLKEFYSYEIAILKDSIAWFISDLFTNIEMMEKSKKKKENKGKEKKRERNKMTSIEEAEAYFKIFSFNKIHNFESIDRIYVLTRNIPPLSHKK